MSEFNFKSQPYTTIEQSQRLIALGLKVETADCCHWYCISCVDEPIEGGNIPAWSLHRLIDMADTTTYINEGRDDENELWFCMDKCYCWNNHESFYSTNLYDSLINCIAWLIKEGYFPKEYLQEQAGSSREG